MKNFLYFLDSLVFYLVCLAHKKTRKKPENLVFTSVFLIVIVIIFFREFTNVLTY